MTTAVMIADIAEALGVHRTSAQRRATREKWAFQETDGRGGKEKRYLVGQLPKTVQVAIAAKQSAGDLLPAATAPVSIFPEPDATPTIKTAPPSMTQRMEEKMKHKAALLGLYNRALAAAGWGNKVPARLEFEQAYNSGLAWPHLYEQLGPVSWKTIEAWAVKVRKHNNDCFFLADKRGVHLRGKCSLSEQQTEIFLRCVLRPNKPRIDGTPVRIYGWKTWTRSWRDRCIRRDYDTGKYSGVELARKYGLQERQIWNILGRSDERQLRLF